MSELAMEFTDDNFNSEVESSDMPVLVDFQEFGANPKLTRNCVS